VGRRLKMEGWEEIEYLGGEDMCKRKVGGEERFTKEKNFVWMGEYLCQGRTNRWSLVCLL
jgi:hypothetical protein